MKKILIFFVLIIMMIGVSGCMNGGDVINNNSNQYKEQILVYLEQKYGENFVIDKILRRVEIEEADVVLAQCHSEQYPNEVFDVIYHLSMDDIYKKDEIIELLKESGTYDESKLKKWESEIEPYFEDNYTNVIMQHQYDEDTVVPSGVKVITRITTPNYYPDASDKACELSQYCTSDRFDITCYNYVFVSAESNLDEQYIISSVVNKRIKDQYINVIWTDKNFEDCSNVYYENYDFPYEAFEQDAETKKIKHYSFRYGV